MLHVRALETPRAWMATGGHKVPPGDACSSAATRATAARASTVGISTHGATPLYPRIPTTALACQRSGRARRDPAGPATALVTPSRSAHDEGCRENRRQLPYRGRRRRHLHAAERSSGQAQPGPHGDPWLLDQSPRDTSGSPHLLRIGEDVAAAEATRTIPTRQNAAKREAEATAWPLRKI